MKLINTLQRKAESILGRKKQLPDPDYLLIGSFLIILFGGLVMLSSASSVISYQRFGSSYYYFKHQLLFGIIPGLIVLWWASKYYYEKWKNWAMPLLIVGFILLALVLIPGLGTKIGGAKSWLDLRIFTFQPVELMKLALIIYLSAWFIKKARQMDKWKETLLPFLIVLGLTSGIIFLQPDLGSLVIVCVIAVVIYFLAGAPWKYLFGLFGAGILVLAGLIFMAPYRLARLTTFLNPQADTLGVGYHINQALIAIGSGGFWGLGLGHSRQKFAYLPEVIGDSIFAVISEELGFLLLVCFVFIYALFLYRGFLLARQNSNPFAKLLAGGITAWFAFQAIINIGAMLSLMPLTGVTLPFISYGSSSMIISLLAVGILINISRYTDLGDKRRWIG